MGAKSAENLVLFLTCFCPHLISKGVKVRNPISHSSGGFRGRRTLFIDRKKSDGKSEVEKDEGENYFR
jgi:hypothetical protein